MRASVQVIALVRLGFNRPDCPLVALVTLRPTGKRALRKGLESPVPGKHTYFVDPGLQTYDRLDLGPKQNSN